MLDFSQWAINRKKYANSIPIDLYLNHWICLAFLIKSDFLVNNSFGKVFLNKKFNAEVIEVSIAVISIL